MNWFDLSVYNSQHPYTEQHGNFANKFHRFAATIVIKWPHTSFTFNAAVYETELYRSRANICDFDWNYMVDCFLDVIRRNLI